MSVSEAGVMFLCSDLNRWDFGISATLNHLSRCVGRMSKIVVIGDMVS